MQCKKKIIFFNFNGYKKYETIVFYLFNFSNTNLKYYTSMSIVYNKHIIVYNIQIKKNEPWPTYYTKTVLFCMKWEKEIYWNYF